MRGPAGGGAAPAWALMELQGELVVKANAGAAARGLSRQEAQAHPGLEIGALDVRGGGAEASLVVGPHKLAGERAELQRPLVALRREADGGYRVVGVVRHKFAFKKRPQILITKSKAPVQRAAKRVRAEAPGGGGRGGAWGRETRRQRLRPRWPSQSRRPPPEVPPPPLPARQRSSAVQAPGGRASGTGLLPKGSRVGYYECGAV